MNQRDKQFQPKHSNLIGSMLLAALCYALAPISAFAADADGNQDEDEIEAASEQAAEDAQSGEADDSYGEFEGAEQVVVTGSRIKRSTYTSITPLQIIHAEVKREAGLIDAAEIIQESSTSAGQQIDLSFTGLVLDDGPGASTANLRGLGASRTLVLLNGRRLAPTGVEGVPASPNLNIVPGLLVQQYDQLLDGASSVYGSDAVAGVINAILRKDFNGLTVEAAPSLPQHGGGEVRRLGLSWGRNWDRGFIGMGAQYYDSEPVTLAERPWTSGCERHVEVDEGGRIRHTDLSNSTNYGMRPGDCRLRLSQRVLVPNPIGWVYYTPGTTNGGWPNFSESNSNWARGLIGIDSDGDGTVDVDWSDYNYNASEGRSRRHLFTPYRSTNAMVYGEYTFEGEANLTPYFEVLFGTSRNSQSTGGNLPIFPWVPALNPYNICNPEGAGRDCGLALRELYRNPGFIRGWSALHGDLCTDNNIPMDQCSPLALPDLFPASQGRELGPQRTLIDVRVRGDRDTIRTESDWVRGVVGVRGDMPFMNVGSLSNWTFDASIMHSSSQAESHRPGIRADRLDLALGYYSKDWTPCENNISEAEREARTDSLSGPLLALTADAATGCVPVNLFSESLYAQAIGDFGTPEERNYVFDSRDFDTRYKQTLFSAYATGELFRMPGGKASASVGAEYRVDEIESIPDEVARDGLFWGFFSDGGAESDKYTREFFGEIEMPLLAGKPGAREITANLSARFTDDEFYGGAWTGAAKVGWRPIDSLLIRGTFGTSYRAPNLRELFLRAQSSFPTVADPCYVPDVALEENLGGERTYNAALDTRDEYVLQRCRDEGVDPTRAGGGAFTSYSVESVSGGSLDLDEETSESLSAGFAWEQPFTKAFGLTLGMTYYDIEIENTIIEPSVGFIVFDCYQSQQSTGQFCDRITRNLDNADDPRMRLIEAGFLNRDSERVRGVDLNIAADTTLTVFERALDLSFDVTGHRLIERTTLFVNDAGEQTTNRDAREWFFNEYRAEMAMRVDYERWRLSWQSRYLGPNEGFRGFEDEYGDINGTPFFSSTCLGPPTDVQCKDVETAPDYWIHHASLTYRGDDWRIVGGVRNVFDKSPPQVDTFEVGGVVANTPRGAGYDLNGRLYFLTATISFDDV